MTVQPEATSPLSGAIASEQQRASDIGAGILAAGGNAVDAIIATIIAVNTLAPFHSDLGGGGFAIVRTPEGKYEGLDFRHTAPAAVTMDFYKQGASTTLGGSAVATPGQMRGLEALHKRYGQLPWAKLFEDSIRLARDGAEMRGDLYAERWEILSTERGTLAYNKYTKMDCVPPKSDSIAGSFYESDPMYHPLFKDGKILPLGEKYYRPEYARTLELIAEKGADAFYHGEVAEGTIKVVQERGGLLSMDDLKNYKATWVEPISAKYRDYTLYTLPAPASGAIWLSAMGTLQNFEPAGEGSVLDAHRVTEALRLAYGQRTELGDPAFVPEVVEQQRSWISEGSTRKRAAMLSDERTFPPEYYTPPKVEIKYDNGTSNITTADSTGLVVSITTTVGLNWGSRIMVPGYGFVLNDSMDDGSVEGRPNGTGYEPTKANFIAGGKKPLSSSCPYIVADQSNRVVLAGGSAGGSTIISANTQVARNVLDYDMSAAEALAASRLHNQILPNVSYIEPASSKPGQTPVKGFSQEVAKGLQEKGHVLEWVVNRSTPCAIKFKYSEQAEGGVQWEVAGDPRKHDSGGSVYYS